MFDSDDMFLVDTFKSIVQSLPPALIKESMMNGSYYDFHIKTEEHIIIPKDINFTFKYIHLIKEKNPSYWSRLMGGWDKLVSPLFGDPLDKDNREKINRAFDKVYSENPYGIMPPLEKVTEHFFYFTNLEKVAIPAPLTISTAYKFSKMYDNPVEHWWNSDVKTYIFPVNNTKFYGIVENKLVMLYPKWNAHRWSTELPKFIIDTRNLNQIIKFHSFDIDKEQESIRIMNGAAKKDIFR